MKRIKKTPFLDFNFAREFVHSLKIDKEKNWRKYAKSGNKPRDIPSAPEHYYKEEWKGWGDWLGNGRSWHKHFLSFEDAKSFVITLGLKNQIEWTVFCKSGKRPRDIPTNPVDVYKDSGWVSWGDWLGTGTIALSKIKYLPFENARDFIRTIKFKSVSDYRNWNNLPNDIPYSPHHVYQNNGWVSWSDWLGTEVIATQNIKFISFSEAKKFVVELRLSGQEEWNLYAKSGNKPRNIPSNPSKAYKDNGWIDWGDWLGTGTIANSKREFLPFEDAKNFIQTLNIYSPREWEKYSKSGNKPDKIPARPQKVYKEWICWRDWLGTEPILYDGDNNYRQFDYWDIWDNVVKDFNKIFDLNNGIFPSNKEFKLMRIPIERICKLHNLSLAEVADKFNCKLASKRKCRDGHFVDSFYEAAVDEYLFSRNIIHSVHPRVGNYNADFLVDNFYIEIWGYPKKHTKSSIAIKYNEKKELKKEFYSSIDLPLIEIEASEVLFEPLINILKVEAYLDNLFSSYGFDTISLKPFNANIVASTGFIWTEDKIHNEINLIMNIIGKFPVEKDIKNASKSGLLNSINKFGGLKSVRNKMGYV